MQISVKVLMYNKNILPVLVVRLYSSLIIKFPAFFFVFQLHHVGAKCLKTYMWTLRHPVGPDDSLNTVGVKVDVEQTVVIRRKLKTEKYGYIVLTVRSISTIYP